MKTNHQKTLLLTCAVGCLALPAEAADRMRPGQWVGVTTVGSKTFNTSACISQSDADAISGIFAPNGNPDEDFGISAYPTRSRTCFDISVMPFINFSWFRSMVFRSYT